MTPTAVQSIATKQRMIEAAVEAIQRHGNAGASARTIADIAGVNQALIYYHFGSLKGLLIAALDATSEKRMALYQDHIAGIGSLEDLVRVARDLYREDIDQGTITVLSELVSACLTHPDLRPEVMARLEPWIDLAEGLVRKLTAGTFLDGMLPIREIAQGLVALYMGMEMLYQLDGDSSRTDRLFEALSTFVPLISPLLGSSNEDGETP